ncbi:NADP-dependent oxidoreductase domain containing protein [Actinobacteria bacterium OK074]|nr:NADP-dependent oxidoreductase domain containing protein [Actinobacteria bacterium OK074]
MEYTRLGSGGPVISRVAYGNSLTAGNQVDEATAHACVRTALDAGITVFDTADVYAEGRGEEVLGRALSGVARESVVICTKVGRGAPAGVRPLSREHVLASADASLRRLGTDHIDLYQAHLYDPATPLEETADAFSELVRAGKVRYVGVSEWAADEIEAFAALDLPLVSNQPQYSMLWRVPQTEVVPACEPLGIGQLAWSPLAGGVLTGKYLPGAYPPLGSRLADARGGDVSLNRFRFLAPEVLDRVALLARATADTGLTLPQLALAWVLGRPGVSAAVTGASSPQQLTANLRAVGARLDEAVRATVDDLLGPVIVTDPRLTLSRMARQRAIGGPSSTGAPAPTGSPSPIGGPVTPSPTDAPVPPVPPVASPEVSA